MRERGSREADGAPQPNAEEEGARLAEDEEHEEAEEENEEDEEFVLPATDVDVDVDDMVINLSSLAALRTRSHRKGKYREGSKTY